MHEQTTEQRETLRAEVLITFRRLGSERVHCALVMPDTISHGSHWGAECDFAATPIVAWCGRTLRGAAVVIPAEYLDGWKESGKLCRECQHIARLALERIDAPLV